MKRPRPYIPLAVRIAVAERQWFGKEIGLSSNNGSNKRWLDFLLSLLSDEPMQLDHDPALILRPCVLGVYSPDANDPLYLIYRPKAEHQQKTTGRRPGAERTITTKGSDIGLKAKFARLERKDLAQVKSGKMTAARLLAMPERRFCALMKNARKIPSRPFPKGRGFSKP